MCSQSVLDEITSKVVRAAKDSLGDRLDRVILYGSYARGDYDGESDIDIMVLSDMSAAALRQYRGEMARIASRLSLESDGCVTISVDLEDVETFEKYKTILPFYRNVVSEGVVLYAA